MKRLRCGVIGLGYMGRNHARIYGELPGVQLVAVADTNHKLVSDIGSEVKATPYADYKKMIAKENLDAVSICTPTPSHYVIARDCINQGIGILLEKPITDNVRKAQLLVTLAKKKKVPLMVGHIERFNPAVIAAKKLVDSGKLGRIISMSARRVGGPPPRAISADIAVDLAIHDVDILNYFMNDVPVRAMINRQSAHTARRHDSVDIFLKYKRASALIQANWITPVKIRELIITGDKGYLELDYIKQSAKFYTSTTRVPAVSPQNFSEYIKRTKSKVVNLSINAQEPLKEEIRYFISQVKKNAVISAEYAVDALRVVAQ